MWQQNFECIYNFVIVSFPLVGPQCLRLLGCKLISCFKSLSFLLPYQFCRQACISASCCFSMVHLAESKGPYLAVGHIFLRDRCEMSGSSLMSTRYHCWVPKAVAGWRSQAPGASVLSRPSFVCRNFTGAVVEGVSPFWLLFFSAPLLLCREKASGEGFWLHTVRVQLRAGGHETAPLRVWSTDLQWLHLTAAFLPY